MHVVSVEDTIQHVRQDVIHWQIVVAMAYATLETVFVFLNIMELSAQTIMSIAVNHHHLTYHKVKNIQKIKLANELLRPTK